MSTIKYKFIFIFWSINSCFYFESKYLFHTDSRIAILSGSLFFLSKFWPKESSVKLGKIPPPSSLAASKSVLWAHFIANSLAFIIKRIVESVYCKKETKVNSDLILHTTIQPILVEDMIFFSVLQRILAWMFADSDSQFFCCLLGCWGFPDWVVSYTILAEDCILYNFSWRLYPIQF